RLKYQPVRLVNFLFTNRMTHPWKYISGYSGVHCCQNLCGFVYALDGNVGVGVAGAYIYRRFKEIALVVFVVDLITDEAAGKRDGAAPPAGVSCDEFKGEARTLRESQEIDFVVCDAGFVDVMHNFCEQVHRRREPWLILTGCCEERQRVPGMVCRLWCQF